MTLYMKSNVAQHFELYSAADKSQNFEKLNTNLGLSGNGM